MPDPRSSSRCSGTRMLRWAALVVPTAVVLTGSFGTSAYAAAGGNAAAHTASSSSSGANMGVGNGVGNGNDKHSDATTTDTSTTTATTAAATTTDASSTSASSTASHQVDCKATPSDPLCSPQPLSNADQNTGGANGQCTSGPYCSTRDGSASGNGNQTQGQHTGEPCAGCVGKADNKNPKGQMPNGSDHNAGYECDRNHGIGRTNPAHTGCKTTTTITCPTGTVKASDGTCKTPCQINPNGTGCNHNSGGDCTTNPTAAGCQTETGGGCAANPSAAGCDNSGAGSTACVPTAANGFCSSVLGEKVTRKPTVQGEKVVKKTPGSLPFTGSDITGLLLAASVGLGTGSGLLVVGRRRRLHA